MANPSKFYSAAQEAAQRIASGPKDKPVPLKKLREMLLNYGAKANELEWIGFDPKVKAAPESTMTPSELEKYVSANVWLPEEKILGGAPKRPDSVADRLYRLRQTDPQAIEYIFGRHPADFYYGRSEEERMRNWRQSPDDITYYLRNNAQGHLPGEHDIQNAETEAFLQRRLDNYLLQGGPPPKYADKPTQYGNYTGNRYEPDDPNRPSRTHSDYYTEMLFMDPKSTWGGGHYGNEGKGAFGHMRFDPEVRPGVFRVDESQSDLHQKARKYGGYRPANWAQDIDRLNTQLQRLTSKRAKLYSSMKPYEDIMSRVASYQQAAGDYSPAAQDFLKQVAAIQLSGGSEKEKMRLIDAVIPRMQERISALSEMRHLPPDTPLKDSSDWTAMMMRRALLEAAERDATTFEIPSGDIAVSRYYRAHPRYWEKPGAEPDLAKTAKGLHSYHENVLKPVTDKLLRTYGGEPTAETQPRQLVRPGSEPGREIEMQGYRSTTLPDKLKDMLRRKGKVPFFRKGGKVFREAND